MIRILRIIEYTYETPELAEEDMNRWQVPAIGTYSPMHSGKIIKSTIITDLNFDPPSDDDDDISIGEQQDLSDVAMRRGELSS